MHPHSPTEKTDAIRQAAQEPQLFAELAERFPGEMPNEDLLRNYLVRKGFAPGALSAVILAYRETSDLVQREIGGYASMEIHSEEPPATMHQAAPTPQQPPPQTAVIIGGERPIGRYDFEGGAYVRIAAYGEIDTEAALEMVQTLIDLKRAEIARKKVLANVAPSVINATDENE
jgi:hypothetical protein